MPKSLKELIDCARRELALRKNVYPGWIRKNQMTQAKADHEIECMAAIVERLETLQMLKEVGDEILGSERQSA